MTLKELSRLRWLSREIELDTERLAKLEAKMAPGGQAFDRIPAYGGTVSDKVGQLASEMGDLRDSIRGKRQKCILERSRLEKYIADVDDSLTRLTMTMRYVDGLTWRMVARRLGGGNTAEGCRKRCQRYVKSHKIL